MKECRLAMIGFGNAGQAFARMLLEKEEEIRIQYDTAVKVTAIFTNTKGNLYAPEGLDLEAALADVATTGKFRGNAGANGGNAGTLDGNAGANGGNAGMLHAASAPVNQLTDMTALQMLEEGEYDCMIELTPLNIFTGQPATDHIRAALKRGKHAITGNKGPVAWHFRELKKLAEENNACFYYETVVMDGTPVFNLVEHTLKMANVLEVSGILNSTTNFILEEMAKGCDMEDIMRRGRAMGFIEADPAMDIEGYDAAGKVTALLNVLMNAGITPDQVQRKGIEDITMEDIQAAAERGNVIKLLCRGTRDEEGNVIATVGPEEVPKTDMLATIDSTTSIVSITTDLMKTISIVEHEPEIEQTAYGIFSDLLRVIS